MKYVINVICDKLTLYTMTTGNNFILYYKINSNFPPKFEIYDTKTCNTEVVTYDNKMDIFGVNKADKGGLMILKVTRGIAHVLDMISYTKVLSNDSNPNFVPHHIVDRVDKLVYSSMVTGSVGILVLDLILKGMYEKTKSGIRIVTQSELFYYKVPNIEKLKAEYAKVLLMEG